MIEQLQERYTREGYAYCVQPPSNFELMEKINELVEEVNRLKKKLGEE